MARCRACHEEIAFVKLASGRLMPVEGLEVETYYLHADHAFGDAAHPRLVIVTDEGEVIRGRQGTVNESGVLKVEGRESHFAGCPGAAAFRKS